MCMFCVPYTEPMSPTFHPPFADSVLGEDRHFHSRFVSVPSYDIFSVGVLTVFYFAAHRKVKIKVKLSDKN